MERQSHPLGEDERRTRSFIPREKRERTFFYRTVAMFLFSTFLAAENHVGHGGGGSMGALTVIFGIVA
jgi:hypothetical protein